MSVESFPKAAKRELVDVQLRTNLRAATDTIQAKRARVVGELPDWEELRDAGSAIKADVLAHLDEYLIQFEAAVTAAGGQVHWASDAAEANAVVIEVARAHGVSEVVKMKSLTTDEIHLNAALAEAGIHALETDFAELILQLDGDWSSHILVPAIHRNRREIRDLFARTIADGDHLRRAARPGGGFAALPARALPEREGRCERRELRRRRDRHDLHRRVRGQRPHVHDAARGPRQRRSGSRSWCRRSPTSRSSCSCCHAPRPVSA